MREVSDIYIYMGWGRYRFKIFHTFHTAFLLFVLTYGSALYFGFFTDLLDLGWIYDNYAALLTATCIFRCEYVWKFR